MKNLTNIITNKYVLVLLFFIVWMMFFDQRDFFEQKTQKDELEKLEKKKAYYIQEIEKTKKELGDLENNPETLEKYARERYLMKKDGEDIFIIEDSANDKK